MSTQVQSQPIGFSYGRTTLIALIAFTFGVVGAFAIQRAADPSSTVEATSSYTLWDTGRLEAMEGRQVAASISTQPVVWDSFMSEAMVGRQLAETVESQPVVWDAAKLEAIEGRQLAETVGSQPVVWDAAKLKAFEGRQLAEVDPVVWDSFMSEPTRSLIGELSHGQV